MGLPRHSTFLAKDKNDWNLYRIFLLETPILALRLGGVTYIILNFEPTLRSESREWKTLFAEPRGGNESLSLVILNYKKVATPKDSHSL